jgi:hypothetical protein
LCRRIDLLSQPPGRHAEQIRDLGSGKHGQPRPQEELARLALEHNIRKR